MRDAGPDLMVATRAAIDLDGLLPGHSADQPVPVRAGFGPRPAMPTDRRRRSGTVWHIVARHQCPLYVTCVINAGLRLVAYAAVHATLRVPLPGMLDDL